MIVTEESRTRAEDALNMGYELVSDVSACNKRPQLARGPASLTYTTSSGD